MIEASVIRSPELARRMGISPSTLWDMTQRNATLMGCAIDQSGCRLWWSVARLRERGFLLPAPIALPPATGSSGHVG